MVDGWGSTLNVLKKQNIYLCALYSLNLFELFTLISFHALSLHLVCMALCMYVCMCTMFFLLYAPECPPGINEVHLYLNVNFNLIQ